MYMYIYIYIHIYICICGHISHILHTVYIYVYIYIYITYTIFKLVIEEPFALQEAWFCMSGRRQHGCQMFIEISTCVPNAENTFVYSYSFNIC